MHNAHQIMGYVVFYVQACKVVPVSKLAQFIQNVYGVEVYIYLFLDPFDKWRGVVTVVLGETTSIRHWMKGGGWSGRCGDYKISCLCLVSNPRFLIQVYCSVVTVPTARETVAPWFMK